MDKLHNIKISLNFILSLSEQMLLSGILRFSKTLFWTTTEAFDTANNIVFATVLEIYLIQYEMIQGVKLLLLNVASVD